MLIEEGELYTEKGIRFDQGDFLIERVWHGHTIRSGGNSTGSSQGHFMLFCGAIKALIQPMKGSAGASVEAKTNSDGGSSIKGEAHVTAKDDNGGKVSVQAEGRVKNDCDGKVKADAGVKISVEKDF